MSERSDSHARGLVIKTDAIAKSPFGKDLSGHSYWAPDASGFANGGVSVNYKGVRVLDFNRVHGEVETYIPGDWEQSIEGLYREKVCSH